MYKISILKEEKTANNTVIRYQVHLTDHFGTITSGCAERMNDGNYYFRRANDDCIFPMYDGQSKGVTTIYSGLKVNLGQVIPPENIIVI